MKDATDSVRQAEGGTQGGWRLIFSPQKWYMRS